MATLIGAWPKAAAWAAWAGMTLLGFRHALIAGCGFDPLVPAHYGYVWRAFLAGAVFSSPAEIGFLLSWPGLALWIYVSLRRVPVPRILQSILEDYVAGNSAEANAPRKTTATTVKRAPGMLGRLKEIRIRRADRSSAPSDVSREELPETPPSPPPSPPAIADTPSSRKFERTLPPKPLPTSVPGDEGAQGKPLELSEYEELLGNLSEEQRDLVMRAVKNSGPKLPEPRQVPPEPSVPMDTATLQALASEHLLNEFDRVHGGEAPKVDDDDSPAPDDVVTRAALQLLDLGMDVWRPAVDDAGAPDLVAVDGRIVYPILVIGGSGVWEQDPSDPESGYWMEKGQIATILPSPIVRMDEDVVPWTDGLLVDLDPAEYSIHALVLASGFQLEVDPAAEEAWDRRRVSVGVTEISKASPSAAFVTSIVGDKPSASSPKISAVLDAALKRWTRS